MSARLDATDENGNPSAPFDATAHGINSVSYTVNRVQTLPY